MKKNITFALLVIMSILIGCDSNDPVVETPDRENEQQFEEYYLEGEYMATSLNNYSFPVVKTEDNCTTYEMGGWIRFFKDGRFEASFDNEAVACDGNRVTSGNISYSRGTYEVVADTNSRVVSYRYVFDASNSGNREIEGYLPSSTTGTIGVYYGDDLYFYDLMSVPSQY